MSKTTPEQRQSPRVAFISSAVIRYDRGQAFEAKVDTRNISMGGVYLETETRIPVDTPCRLTIQLAGITSKMSFKVQGTICRHDATGMGIAFTQINPDSYLHITNLINLHSAEER